MRQTETDDVCYLNTQPAYKVCRSGTETAAQMKVLELKRVEEPEGERGGGKWGFLAMKESGRFLQLPLIHS